MSDNINYAALPPVVDSLVAVLKKLRSPDGCPWDRVQTRETLARCLAEECAELLEAIDNKDIPSICDELGDLLMNVIMQTVVAGENGEFALADVVGGINAKLIRRHAHVFGEASADTPDAVVALWEKIKATEKRGERKSQLDGIPPEMSALSRSEKLQTRAAKVGFDWNCQAAIVDKIAEELAELREAIASGDEAHADEELGDLLFSAANLARFRKRRTSEELLRQAGAKFTRRFHFIENELKKNGTPLSSAGTARLEELWQQAKCAKKNGGANKKDDILQ